MNRNCFVAVNDDDLDDGNSVAAAVNAANDGDDDAAAAEMSEIHYSRMKQRNLNH